MNGIKKLGLFFLVFTALVARGDDFLQLSVVGAANFSTPSLNAGGVTIPHTGRTVFGVGALASFPIFPLFRLETGVLYLPHGYSQGAVDTTLKTFHVPVLVRLEPIPLISLGAGGYVGFATGQVSTYDNIASRGQDYTYEQLNWGKTDFGFLISASLNLPVAPMTALFLDVRYLVGLKNIDNTIGDDLKMNGFVGLAGLKFAL
jgi:hypothetical protein